ncbi:MAG: PAS domain-containing protein [Bacteroidales bacterium]|jgi:DUF438 domain-containing protein|nr:PAS domain-containing protein [Bacteroidales bacterium]
MSEIQTRQPDAPEGLHAFARGIMTNTDVKGLITRHRKVIDRATPHQTMEVLDNLIRSGFTVAEVKDNVGKILNMLHKALAAFRWPKPGEDHFLHWLMLENREAEKHLKRLRALTKRYFNGIDENEDDLCRLMLETINSLRGYELHYIKKENILFPHIEREYPSYRCLHVMWSFHDDFRSSMKALTEILSSTRPPRETLNREMGKLFFTVIPIIFREEQIVFPVALSVMPAGAWAGMLAESHETGWYGIDPDITEQKLVMDLSSGIGAINLRTGYLTPEQITIMLDTLPVDITFVDENDTVRYFSGARHRIFPRSKSIIGRKVQNCHPPDSVHVVEDILKAFRERQRDHADFWIPMGQRFIYIRYFALYDSAGTYRGTIEVSQDATEIMTLTGERRLLQWD